METTKQLIQTSITAVIKGHGKCKRASTSSKRLWWGVQPHSCTPPMCYKSSSHQTSFLHMLKPNTSIFSFLPPVITKRLFISKHSAFLVFCPLGALHRPQVTILDMPKPPGFSSRDDWGQHKALTISCRHLQVITVWPSEGHQVNRDMTSVPLQHTSWKSHAQSGLKSQLIDII